jgi:peroxiredoxin
MLPDFADLPAKSLSWVVAGLLAASCSPEPPPPAYPTGASKATPGTDERQLAVEKPPPAADHSDPGEGRTELGAAPPGTWVASDGARVSVESLHSGRGAVVVFYRGSWCKACRTQLAELSDAVAEFKGRNFEVHAISTDSPEKSRELIGRLGLDFQLYSDVGGFASRAWGVYTREHDLARPAVFVVAPGGEVVYRYVSDTPTDRPKVGELLEIAERATRPEKTE